MRGCRHIPGVASVFGAGRCCWGVDVWVGGVAEGGDGLSRGRMLVDVADGVDGLEAGDGAVRTLLAEVERTRAVVDMLAVFLARHFSPRASPSSGFFQGKSRYMLCCGG